MSPAEIEARFSQLGARFVLPVEELADRLRAVRALVFDWDGVFNAGEKGDSITSTFSEADSMGTNLWRYGLWRLHGGLPVTAIISGANNPTARQFATREHFTAVYSGYVDKRRALDEHCARYGLEGADIACLFDDVNDLPMAEVCGVRLMIRRDASPLFSDFAVAEGLCDYVSGAAPGQHAVREIAELALCLMGCFEDVIRSRVAFDDEYRRYFEARQAVPTALSPQPTP